MNPNTLAKLAKFLPEEAIARLRAKALASEASSTQDILGQWMKQSYPQTVEGTSIFKGTPTQKLEETAHTLRNRVEVDPTIPAEEIFRTYSKVMGHANATEDEAKALARYTSNYEEIGRASCRERV